MLRDRSKITVHDCLPSTDTCVFFVCFTDLHSPCIGVVQPKIVQFVLILILVCGCVDLSPPLLPAGVQIIVYEEEDQREFVRDATSMCAWQLFLLLAEPALNLLAIICKKILLGLVCLSSSPSYLHSYKDRRSIYVRNSIKCLVK